MPTTYGESYESYAAGDEIRSSDVIAFHESPQLMRDRLDGLRKPASASMDFGRIAHMAILEPVRYQATVIPRPDTYPSDKGDKPWHECATWCKQWNAEQAREGKTPVDADDFVRLYAMRQRMPTQVRDLFTSGAAEVCMRATVRDISCKIRVDWLDEINSRYIDLKTVKHIRQAESHIHKYGYHIQSAFYSEVLAAETGRKFSGRLVFAETAPPYRWRVLELDMDYRDLGRQIVCDALDGIRQCRADGDWGDHGDVYELVSPPTWMQDEDAVEDESEVA